MPYKRIRSPNFYVTDKYHRYHVAAKKEVYQMELYDARTKQCYEFEGSIGVFTSMSLKED